MPPRGFEALFNGRDLTGWFGHAGEDPRPLLKATPEELARIWEASMKDVKAHWRVENDELVNDGHGHYLTTEKDYGDFELLVEYKTVAKADSGIYLRGVPQVQIWDSTEPDEVATRRGQRLRRAVEQQPRRAGQGPARAGRQAVRRMEQIPHHHGRLAGEHVAERRNSSSITPSWRTTTTARLPIFPARARSSCKRTAARSAGASLHPRDRRRGSDQDTLRRRRRRLHTVFNGKDLDGWAGPVENYEVVGRRDRCKPGKGGSLYTKDEYATSSARLEFKVPPGGNNGLAIRYPGKGDTAYVGMCELQVLDDNYDESTRQARPAAGPRLGLRHGRRRSAATSGRPASGTSRK